MDEKDAIIDFLLNQKVQNEIDNTTFISKVSNSVIQLDKKPILKIRIMRESRRK